MEQTHKFKPVWIALSLILVACMGSGTMTTKSWEEQSAEGFRFSYPTDWNYNTLRAAGEGYLFYMPGKTSGTNIVVLRNPSPHIDLQDLEEKLTAELDKPQYFASSKIVEVKRIQLGGKEAIHMHYNAIVSSSHQEYEGFQVGTLLPDGQAVMLSLGIFDDGDYETATEIFDKMLESVSFDE